MTNHRLAWITAAALTVAPFSPVAADAATPAPARVVAPADVAAPTVVKHVSTDVDGDGTRDSVTLSYLGSNQFALIATTTKGKSSTVTFTSRVNAKWAPAAETWYGASAIDGRKGSELIVNKFTKKTAESREDVTLGVYTWRSGKLVAEKAPATPTGRVWKVNAGAGFDVRGYRFFSSHGHRYVDATRLATRHHLTSPWNGYVTRSVWRSGGWVKLWTHKAKTVKTYPSSWGQVGIAGPKLLLGQVNVDVSGDGASDLVGYYQIGYERYQMTVGSSAGPAAFSFSSYAQTPFLGAAEVDGVPGYELLLDVAPEGPEWKVLTWRSGLLAELPGPKLYGEPDTSLNRTWHGHGDEAYVNFTLGSDAGARWVVVGWISNEDSLATDPVHFTKSVWNVNDWQRLPGADGQWDAVVPADQQAKFRRNGFTVEGLITP